MDDHSSGVFVAKHLVATYPNNNAKTHLQDCIFTKSPKLAIVPIRFCFRWGLPCPPLLPERRCALTAPFHPYQIIKTGGLLSVALSLRSPSPVIIRHRVSVKPGLSSICGFPHCITAIIQPSDYRYFMVKKYLNNINFQIVIRRR